MGTKKTRTIRKAAPAWKQIDKGTYRFAKKFNPSKQHIEFSKSGTIQIRDATSFRVVAELPTDAHYCTIQGKSAIHAFAWSGAGTWVMQVHEKAAKRATRRRSKAA